MFYGKEFINDAIAPFSSFLPMIISHGVTYVLNTIHYLCLGCTSKKVIATYKNNSLIGIEFR